MSEDPTWDDEDEDQEPETKSQFRDQMKALEARAKKADKMEKELASLREWKQDREATDRQGEVAKLFSTAGLSEKHAKLFLAVSDGAEPTAEAVKAFAEEYALSPATQEPAEDAPAERPKAPMYEPTSQGGPPDPVHISRKDLDAQIASGRITWAQARERIGKGEVDFNNPQAARLLQQ